MEECNTRKEMNSSPYDDELIGILKAIILSRSGWQKIWHG